MANDSYLKLLVNFGRADLEFNKPLQRFDFSDLSDLISYYSISVELMNFASEEDSEGEKIASLNGYFYDMDYIYKYGQGLFDTFDMISGDTNKIYDILFSENEIKLPYQTFTDNIFYLDRIYVEKEYRSKGYAKLLLNQLEEIIKYIAKLNVGIIVACAQPFEIVNGEEKIIRKDLGLKNKLIELYKKTGFVETDDKFGYLVKVIED